MQKNFKGSDQHRKEGDNAPPKKNFKKRNFCMNIILYYVQAG